MAHLKANLFLDAIVTVLADAVAGSGRWAPRDRAAAWSLAEKHEGEILDMLEVSSWKEMLPHLEALCTGKMDARITLVAECVLDLRNELEIV